MTNPTGLGSFVGSRLESRRDVTREVWENLGTRHLEFRRLFEDFSKPFAAFLVVGFVFGFNRSGNVSQLDGPVLQKTVVLVNMSCILFL